MQQRQTPPRSAAGPASKGKEGVEVAPPAELVALQRLINNRPSPPPGDGGGSGGDGGSDTGASDVHEAAKVGTSGASGPLPFLDVIQRSFGKHDVSAVAAHTDGAAAEGAKAMNASAFATGNHVAFAGEPSLHTAAHEAAHVVQQRAGVQLSGGVGQAGDPYEKHADAVADLVVQGQSAEALLDGRPAGKSGVESPVQRIPAPQQGAPPGGAPAPGPQPPAGGAPAPQPPAGAAPGAQPPAGAAPGAQPPAGGPAPAQDPGAPPAPPAPGAAKGIDPPPAAQAPFPDPVEEIGKALKRKDETAAFTLMEQITKWDQARAVLAQFQADAVRCFNNKEMGKATEILVRKGGRLDLALDWMFDEGTDWTLLRTTVKACNDENWKEMVRNEKYRDLFVKEVNNEEMAELVDLIGGPIDMKLNWMFKEGTNYKTVYAKIDAAKKANADSMKVLQTKTWRDFFVKEYGNDEVGDLALLIGGKITDLVDWMIDEGTDGEHLVKVIDEAKKNKEDIKVLHTDVWRDKFVKALGNKGMYDIVKALDLPLMSQVLWMWHEGYDNDWMVERLQAASEADRVDLLTYAGKTKGWENFLKKFLWGFVGTNVKQLFGDAVNAFWLGFGEGSKFSAEQCYHFLFLLTGKKPKRATDSPLVFATQKFKVVDADDDTLREFLNILRPGGPSGPKGIDRAELAQADLAFCTQRDTGTGWKDLDTSYFTAGTTIVIRVIGKSKDDTEIGEAKDETPTAVGTGLTYFQNHVRHEIGHAVGQKKIGTMGMSGNEFAMKYGGFNFPGSNANFVAAMWVDKAMPGTQWPEVEMGDSKVRPTNVEVRTWCLDVLSTGIEPANTVGGAKGTVIDKVKALKGSLWRDEKALDYLLAIGRDEAKNVPENAYYYPGFTPTNPVQVYLSRTHSWTEYSYAAYQALKGISWYALSSPSEMFAEMYTARYGKKKTPDPVNTMNPDTFFTQLEAQRNPMFGQ